MPKHPLLHTLITSSANSNHQMRMRLRMRMSNVLWNIIALVITFTLCISALFVPNTAQAQLFGSDELDKKIEEITQRQNEVVKILREIRKEQTSQRVELQRLNEDLKIFKGSIEELEHTAQSAGVPAAKEISKLKAELNKLREDFTKTQKENILLLSLIEKPDEQTLYNNAFNELQNKNYHQSVAEFKKVLNFYPNGKFAPNASYWQANAYYNLSNFNAAKDILLELLRSNSSSDKVPDASLLLARCLIQLKQVDDAQKLLTKLITDYPTSLAADKARSLL